MGRLKVYATGIRRVSRQRREMMPEDAGVHDAVRRHLPEHVAGAVEAFRERVGMSPETLGELRRLFRDGGGASTDAGRAEHAGFFLSTKARQEFSRFTEEAQTLSPHVKRALKGAIAKAALRELARPDWEFGDEVS